METETIDKLFLELSQVTQATTAKEIELSKKLTYLQDRVGLAYGFLWCVNNEPGTPNQYPPERAAYEARKLLLDTLTHEQRGEYINRAILIVRPDLGQGS